MQFQLYQLQGDNLLVVSIHIMLSFMLITLSLVGQGCQYDSSHNYTNCFTNTYAVTKVILEISLFPWAWLDFVHSSFSKSCAISSELSVYFARLLGITASVSLFCFVLGSVNN